MALLTQQDLYTHVYQEIIEEIVRDIKLEFANLAACPVAGVTGKKYVALDTAKIYKWQDNSYAEITEKDKVQLAIAAGEAEAKAYLNRFDITAMFTPEFTDELLRNKVKDMVCWHLIRLANPNIDMALFRTLYEDAVKFFEKVMKGAIDPAGWPLRADDPETEIDDAGQVWWSTIPKRGNNF